MQGVMLGAGSQGGDDTVSSGCYDLIGVAGRKERKRAWGTFYMYRRSHTAVSRNLPPASPVPSDLLLE